MSLVQKVAAKFWVKNAGPLHDVSKLRYQAMFLIGAGGSGKGYVAQQWLKYAPGGGDLGYRDSAAWARRLQTSTTQMERGLSNLRFDTLTRQLKDMGITIQPVGTQHARIPFEVFTYDDKGHAVPIPPDRWETDLPKKVYDQVKDLTEVVFSTPVHEIPSYWRQVNPDIYKEELAGYLESQPGYVHEMSSGMAKAYFEAAIATGDPLIMDGTGVGLNKLVYQINRAKAMGYTTSLVFVKVPLTVNHIRNATRTRNVQPHIVTSAWKAIAQNFMALRNLVDTAKVVDNRNDAFDRKMYRQHRDFINSFIAKNTKYADLYSLVQDNAPSELQDWGGILRPEPEAEWLLSHGWSPLTTRARSDMRTPSGEMPQYEKTVAGVKAYVSLGDKAITLWVGDQTLTLHTLRDIDTQVMQAVRQTKTR